MMPHLKPWQHASLAAVLTCVTLAILYVVLIMPAVTNRATFNTRIDTLQHQAAKFDAMLARHAQLAARVQALKHVHKTVRACCPTNRRRSPRPIYKPI